MINDQAATTATTPQQAQRSPLLAYLQLIRAPNVFTAVADVMMGFLFMNGSLAPAGQFAMLVVASCLLYWAGMVLNDVFDIEVDAEQRPQRPIPSGRVPLATAQVLGWGFLAGGVGVAWLASLLFGDWRAGLIATPLAASIVAYDAVLKRTPLGPIAMGSCRFFNVLLGMSLAFDLAGGDALPWTGANWLVAAGIGVYIAGVTWFARREATQSGRVHLIAATAVMFVGIGLLAWLPWWDDRVGIALQLWWLFWAIIYALIGWRCVRAIVNPTPKLVQSAVVQCILSLIVLDAAVAAAVLEPFWGFAIVALVIPTMFLGRWIYST